MATGLLINDHQIGKTDGEQVRPLSDGQFEYKLIFFNFENFQLQLTEVSQFFKIANRCEH